MPIISSKWFRIFLISTKYNNNAVLNRATGFPNSKSKISGISCYVTQSTPKVSQQVELSEHLLRKAPTAIYYIKRTVLMKQVKTQNLWTFDIGTRKGKDFPIYITMGYQKCERLNQFLNNHIF